MKTLNYPDADTSLGPVTKYGCLFTVAAMASTSGLLQPPGTHNVRSRFYLEQPVSSSDQEWLGSQSDSNADTARRGATVGDIANSIDSFLAGQGLKSDRITMTADGSALLEYFNAGVGGVDVYPTGVLVVFTRKDGINNFHELTTADSAEIARLLRNGGIAG
jgi:hypothetical protein